MLLSVGPEAKTAALFLNYLAFGLAMVLLYNLALYAGWSWVQATAMSLALGFGPLRDFAVAAKPDILTYALFLTGMLMYLRDRPSWRLVAYFLWSALIPIKFIAVIFLPGILFAEMCRGLRGLWAEYALAFVVWLSFVVISLGFNYLTIGSWMSPSHPNPTISSLMLEAGRFATSFLRTGLASWYGSIRPLVILIPFSCVLLLGTVCIATLRPSPGAVTLRCMGISLLALSWVLECVRSFYADPRLMGYGMMLVMLGFSPRPASARIWCIYAAATVGLATYNSLTVVRLGVNHPQYERIATEVAELVPSGQMLYTNARRILDVHVDIRSKDVSTLADLQYGAWYFEATLPNYDAIDRPITFPAQRDGSWMKVAELEGGTLYRKQYHYS
jgi:hypothetical protein